MGSDFVYVDTVECVHHGEGKVCGDCVAREIDRLRAALKKIERMCQAQDGHDSINDTETAQLARAIIARCEEVSGGE